MNRTFFHGDPLIEIVYSNLNYQIVHVPNDWTVVAALQECLRPASLHLTSAVTSDSFVSKIENLAYRNQA